MIITVDKSTEEIIQRTTNRITDIMTEILGKDMSNLLLLQITLLQLQQQE